MCERFLKFIPSPAAIEFAIKYKNAFILLLIIAEQARRFDGRPDGLKIGQCHLGNHKNYGMTEKEYRYAKEILVANGLIKIVVTNRTRKKASQTQNRLFDENGATVRATEPTTTGTLVELCNSAIWDINPESDNHTKGDRKGDLRATEGRLKGDKQEGLRKKKNEKESHPSIPSFQNREPKRDDGRTMDDFSSQKEIEIIPGVFISQADLDNCVKLKGSIEKVREAVEYIQGSKKRKHPISDWPNALTRWKIENKAEVTAEGRLAYAETLCKEFPESQHKLPWRCRLYNDRKKDQRGILFEPSSAYKEPFFVALMDGQFQAKCEEFIAGKNMRKK